MNDLNLDNWKHYQGDITTDGLWISTRADKHYIPDRGFKTDPNFHGVFIHEIPYQMMLRYTKANETVWDCFAGSGTTLEVAQQLHRKCIANDLQPIKKGIVQADSAIFNPGKNVQMVIMHPPYWNIVEFSDSKEDLSNFTKLNDFLTKFKTIAMNVNRYLDSNRFLILVCGYIYKDGEMIPLGYHCMEIIRQLGYVCKGIILKDYGETKGGHKNRANLEYYRALKFGYWKFPGDNIFILRKTK